MFGIRGSDTKAELWKDFETEALPYLADMYRVAMWLTRNSTEAEDLVQETMFQAIRSFHRYQMGTNCKAWLMKILYAHNSKRLRKLSHLKLVQKIDEDLNTVPFDPPVPEHITDEEILKAIKNLSEGFRDVLLLADVEELSYKEISSVLDLPTGTVMSRLHRARKILRTELAEQAQEYGIGEDRRVVGN